MSYPEFVNTLKELKIKKKARMPKVSPQKFYPAKIELQLQELLRETFTAFAKRLEATAPAGLSLDSVESVSQIEWEPDDEFNARLSNLASGVSSFNVMAFANFTDLVVGERYFPTQDRKQEILTTWKDNFVELCRSTNTEMKKKVAGVVSDAVLNGTNLRDMVKKIQQTCSTFSRSKAELIATTETGKLNSAIARNQSESAGIDYYEWAAAMDGRTRESHAVMDGRICKWGDDTGYYVWEQGKDGKRKLTRRDRPKNAYIGAPGTDFRCRCTAMPYVPEYEDDYESEREKGEQRGVVQTQENKRKVSGPDNIEKLQGLFEGKRNMLYAGAEKAEDPTDFKLAREQERIAYIRNVIKDYAFVAQRPYDKTLQKDFDIYAKENGSTKINNYMRDTFQKNSPRKHIKELDERISRMIRYINKTPIQKDITLFRTFNIKRDITEKWEKSGLYQNTAFSSFSSSQKHADAFSKIPDKKKNEVKVKVIYKAKKGDLIAAPPYRVLNGQFIGYPEESEYTAIPVEMKIKNLKKKDDEFTFIVENRR